MIAAFYAFVAICAVEPRASAVVALAALVALGFFVAWPERDGPARRTRWPALVLAPSFSEI